MNIVGLETGVNMVTALKWTSQRMYQVTYGIQKMSQVQKSIQPYIELMYIIDLDIFHSN